MMKQFAIILLVLVFPVIGSKHMFAEGPGVLKQPFLPLFFIENSGQWDSDVLYGVIGATSKAAWSEHGLVITGLDIRNTLSVPNIEYGTSGLYPEGKRLAALSFVNPSSKLRISGGKQATHGTNIYKGQSQEGWYENLSSYDDIVYKNVWEGIDISYGEKGGKLQQTFVLHPGADRTNIVFSAEGDFDLPYDMVVREVTVDGVHGEQNDVRFIKGDNGEIKLLTGDSSFDKRMVIRTEFSTYFGGNGRDVSMGLDMDAKGDMYFTASVNSTDLPLQVPYQGYVKGTGLFDQDMYAARLDCDGTTLKYATYFGGSDDEGWMMRYWTLLKNPLDCAKLGQNGSLYVMTNTLSHDYPVSSSALQKDRMGVDDGFQTSAITCFDSSGHLLSSTYLGGPTEVGAYDMDVDNDGNVYLIGICNHEQWFVTPGTIQSSLSNPRIIDPHVGPIPTAGFLVKIGSELDTVHYGTYLFAVGGDNKNLYGGNKQLYLEVDNESRPVIMGSGMSSRNIELVNSHYPYTGSLSLYLMKLKSDASGYVYSTWLGEGMIGLENTDIDAHGNVLICGMGTDDLDQVNPLPGMEKGSFIAKYDTESGAPIFVTMFGGGNDHTTVIKSMPDGDIFLLGNANRLGGFPFVNATDTVQAYDNTIYMARLDSIAKTIEYASYWYLDDTDLYTQLSGRMFAEKGGQPNICFTENGHFVMLFDVLEHHSIKSIHGFDADYNGGHSDLYMIRTRLPGASQVAATISTIDTIRIVDSHSIITPEKFRICVEVENTGAPGEDVSELEGELFLPDGIVLDPDTQELDVQLSPASLSPGEKASYCWTVRVDPQLLDSVSEKIRFVSYFRSTDDLSCLPGSVYASKDIAIKHEDSFISEIRCLLRCEDTLSIDPAGDKYFPERIPLTLILENTGTEAMSLKQVTLYFSDGMACATEPTGDRFRGKMTLEPGVPAGLTWILHPKRREMDRTVLMWVKAFDKLDNVVAYCEYELFVPALLSPRCITGEMKLITVNDQSGIVTPDTIRASLEVENVLDTLQGDVAVEIDISRCRYLRTVTGEPNVRLVSIGIGETEEVKWRLALQGYPDSVAVDTVGFLITSPVSQRSTFCEQVFQILTLSESVHCTLHGPDTLTISDTTYLPIDPVLDYALHNTGNQRIEADRIALDISAESGVMSLDPLLLPGVSLDPGQTVNEQWRLRALTSAFSRNAQFTVTAFDDRDSVLSQCIHAMFIPGIDGLRCVLTAPDTVRFDRAAVSYLPDPVPVFMDLRNVLDTLETGIEVELDLTEAGRFELDAGDTEGRTLASLESHSLAVFSWLLSPQPGDKTEEQQITVHYRSDQQMEWKECVVDIVIEAWTQISEISCETGGHDSLYADDYHEQWIPDPLTLSYSVTNSGTVTLTECRASIVLPPEFVLSGSDIEQEYGTLTPGASAVRWWNISPTMQLTEFKAHTIGWEWTSLEQGTQTGCDHTVHVVPDSPSGIVLTPLHLHFEAEYAGTLPAFQQVQLWTGSGLSMPWTTQIGESWLDAQPAGGSQATRLRVQPNTTLLPEGIYGTDITVSATVQGQSQRISVTYLIDNVTDVSDPVQANSFRLDQNWPNPVSLTGSAATITFHLGEFGRTVLRLYDVMGREVMTMLDTDLEAGSHSLRFSPSSLQPNLTPGMYFYRLIGREKNAIRSMMVVR